MQPAPWPTIPLSRIIWANQSLPYPNNAEHQAREQQVSILKSLFWLNQDSKTARSRLEPTTFKFPFLPEREAGALLIWPLQLVPYSIIQGQFLHGMGG